jgi:hypothetical protein
VLVEEAAVPLEVEALEEAAVLLEVEEPWEPVELDALDDAVGWVALPDELEPLVAVEVLVELVPFLVPLQATAASEAIPSSRCRRMFVSRSQRSARSVPQRPLAVVRESGPRPG